MKIDISEKYEHILKEVYNPLILETSEGNQFAICMRDDTFEMTVIGSDITYRANIETGKIEIL